MGRGGQREGDAGCRADLSPFCTGRSPSPKSTMTATLVLPRLSRPPFFMKNRWRVSFCSLAAYGTLHVAGAPRRVIGGGPRKREAEGATCGASETWRGALCGHSSPTGHGLEGLRLDSQLTVAPRRADVASELRGRKGGGETGGTRGRRVDGPAGEREEAAGEEGAREQAKRRRVTRARSHRDGGEGVGGVGTWPLSSSTAFWVASMSVLARQTSFTGMVRAVSPDLSSILWESPKSEKTCREGGRGSGPGRGRGR